MALSDDQRAMLRLLAQREQGYDDLAALMGLSVDEVRARVKDALEQLEAEGEAPPPVEPPLAKEPSASPPEPDRPAPAEPPQEPASADSPPTPAEPAAVKPPKRPPPPRPNVSLPKNGGARAAIAAGVLVVVALIVVLAIGGGGGGSSDTASSSSSGEGAATAEEASSTAASKSKEVTQAVLEPVGGGSAKGLAVFGRVKNSLALQVEATGLAPTAKGQSYTVWLAQSPQKMLPLATTAVDKTGKIAAQVEVPTEVLAYLAKGTFNQIAITLTSDSTLKASLAKATSEKKAPVYTGTEVLRGTVTGPIVGAANK